MQQIRRNGRAFRQRHYEMLADLVGQLSDDTSPVDVQRALIALFSVDSDKFDRDKFVTWIERTRTEARDA